MANVITTLLRLDSTQFKTGMKSAQQSISETDGVINKAKAGWAGLWDSFKSSPVAVGVATTAVSAFAVQSIAAASDLEESINAVNVTFGESADKILEFGENAAKSVGLAQSEFNQLATPLGSILKNAGFQLDDVADKTIILTQRAADMASVFNTDVGTALSAIQAGLRGEQDPLERFGVGLSAAKVEARALADTGKTTVKSLTDQEKQLARVELILDQTNQTAGDFAETSDSLANQTRILKAEFKNLQATAGQELIPKLSALAGVLIEAKDRADELGAALRDIPAGDTIFGDGDGFFGQLKAEAQGAFDPIKLIENVSNHIDELKKEFGGGGDSLPAVLDRGADGIARVGAAAATTAGQVGETTDEVIDLGDKAANAGPKIGDMAGALEGARQNLADLNEEARNEALTALAGAAEAVGDAIEDAFDGVRDSLDIQDLLDDITDQFAEVAEAEQEATDPEGLRNYNRTVRDLQRQLLTLLESIRGIPPDKKVQIAAEIQRGGIDELYRILGDLSRGLTIPVSFSQPGSPSFSSVNVSAAPGGAPQPIVNAIPSTSLPIYDNRTVINNYPVGTTPTTQYQFDRLDQLRNGVRTGL